MNSEEPTNESENASGQTDKDAASSQPASDKPQPSDQAVDQAVEKKPGPKNPFATLLQKKTTSSANNISDTAANTAATDSSESPVLPASDPAETQIPTEDYDTALLDVIQHLLHTPDAEPIATEPQPPAAASKPSQAAVSKYAEDEQKAPTAAAPPKPPQAAAPTPAKDEQRPPTIAVPPKPAQAADPTPVKDEQKTPAIAVPPKPAVAAVPTSAKDEQKTPTVAIPPKPAQAAVSRSPSDEKKIPIDELTPKSPQAAIPPSITSPTETPTIAATSQLPQTPPLASATDQAETPIFAAIADLMQAPVPPSIKDRPETQTVAVTSGLPQSPKSGSNLSAPSNPALPNLPQMPPVPNFGTGTGAPGTAEPRKVKLQSFGERMVQSVARKTHNALAALEKLASGTPSERLTSEPTQGVNSPAASPSPPPTPRIPPAAPTPDLSEASITSAIQDLLQAPVAPPSLQSQINLPTLQKPTVLPNSPMQQRTFGQRMAQSIARTTHNALAALENLSGFGAQSQRLTPEPAQESSNQASVTAPFSTSPTPMAAPPSPQLSETPINSAIQDLLQAPIVMPADNVPRTPVVQPIQHSPQAAMGEGVQPPTVYPPVEPQLKMRWQAPGQKLVQSIATKTHNALQALKKSAGFGTERLTPEPDEALTLHELDKTDTSSELSEEIDEILRLKRAHELEAHEKARDIRKQRLSRVTSEEDLVDARKHAELMKAGMSDEAATTKPPPLLIRLLVQYKAAVAIVMFLIFLGVVGFFIYQERTKDALIESAEHALQNEQYEQAQRDADRGLASFPKEALFHYYRGRALLQLGNETAALDEINLAQSARKNDLKITALRANLLVQLGQPQAALAAYRQLVEGQYADKAANYAGKATVELMLGHPKDALTDINAAVQHNPGTTKYVRDRALIYSQLQEYAKAISDWNEVIAQHPQDARAYAERGYAEFAAKRTDRALADLAQSMKIGQSAKAYYIRGLIRAELKQNASAISDLNSALRLTEGKTKSAFDAANLVAIFTAGDVLRERAKVEMNLGNYREASEDLRQAIKKGSDNLDARIHLAECNEKLADWSEAYGNYSAAIKLAPEQVDLYVKRGIVSAKQHNYDLAQRDLQSAVIQNPNNIAAYMARGSLYAEQKRFDDAFSDFNHVLRVEPNNIEARRELAQITKNKHSTMTAATPSTVATQEETSPAPAPVTQGESTPMAPMQSGVTAMAQLPAPSSNSPEMQEGYRLMVNGNAAAAINQFTLAVRKNPNNVEARRYLAHALASVGRTADVIAELQLISSRLTPSDGVMLTAAYEQTGNKRAAAVLFQRLTRANPTLSLMRLDLAKIYASSGDTVLLKAACEQGMHMALTEHQRDEFNQLWQQAQRGSSSANAQH